MIQYGFDTDKEYKKYISATKSEKETYLVWKNNLLRHYAGMENREFFVNLIKWLEVRKRGEEYYMKVVSSFALPLIIVLFSFFPNINSLLVSSYQWQDTTQIRIDSELINGGNKLPVESLQESVNKIEIANKYAFAVLYAALFCIVACIIIFPFLAKERLKRIDFYNDCQKIFTEEFLS